MARLGVVCPAMSGHLNPMTTLARELARRGHDVTVLALEDAAARVAAAGLGFHAIGRSEFPPGQTAENTRTLSRMRGLRAVAFTVGLLRQEAEVQLRDVAAAVGSLGLDGLIVDQASAAAGAVAEVCGLPVVTVCNALMFDWEPGVPPFIMPWRYRASWWARLRNRCGYAVQCLAARPVLKSINQYRRRHGLPWLSDPHDFSSPLAVISQVPAGFDFPRTRLRPHFHYVGPLHDGRGRAGVPFPYERLDDRPLVYASMGTLQNGRGDVFRTICEGCRGLDAQLVLSLGGADPGLADALPPDPLIVPYAPQLDLLRRATLAITHAGLNTAMESLACGVPMVAIPVTNDQPAVAARIAWSGTGEVVPLRRLSAARLRRAVEQVLRDDRYRRNACRLRDEIAQCHGPARGADVVERVLATRQPVLPRDVPMSPQAAPRQAARAAS